MGGRPLRMKDRVCARDVMRRDVVTVSEGADLWDLASLFTTRGITGAPVIDERGEVIGVVSQTDIVRHLKELLQSTLVASNFYAEPENDAVNPRSRVLTARDLMTPTIIKADEGTPVDELGRIMLREGVHRLIITRGREIAGIVTTMDLLKVL